MSRTTTADRLAAFHEAQREHAARTERAMKELSAALEAGSIDARAVLEHLLSTGTVIVARTLDRSPDDHNVVDDVYVTMFAWLVATMKEVPGVPA